MIRKDDILALERLVTAMAIKSHLGSAVRPGCDLLLLNEMYISNPKVNLEINRILREHIDDPEPFE